MHKRFAVLIDADNASAAVIEPVLAEVARFGEATVRRIYGDFTSPTSAGWREVLQRNAIKPVQQFAYSKGKNATDISLVIDAMDLLYTGRFDGFCLVTSDSDFTGLTLRLREAGLEVYGFGEQKTPEAFRNACHRFVFTEVLAGAHRPDVDRLPTAAQPTAPQRRPLSGPSADGPSADGPSADGRSGQTRASTTAVPRAAAGIPLGGARAVGR
ncbi:MAG: NYN domain-containing protein [Actinomycetales bacterium]|nr:NYN domain-containing protein [Actinomycetales bacterium]